jgi:hypothetical protein
MALLNSCSNVVGIPRILAEGSGIRIPLGVRNFSALQNAQTGSGAHPDPCSMSTEFLY